MKTLPYRTLSLAVASCLMTACATTQAPQSATTSHDHHAKEVLAKAVKSQLRSSFSYETNAYVSNDIRRHALKDVTDSTPADDCEAVHDHAYVRLLRTAETDNLPISDDKYQAHRTKIKDDFLACRDEQEQASAYQPFDFENFYEQSGQLTPDEQEQAFIHAVSTHLDTQTSEPSARPATPLDAKKAELLHEYLITPSGVRVVGSYQPLQGKFTALPMLDYTAKNLHMSINQPLYIDLKAGGIYLWADNFALLNSELLDAKLGDSWQGKWLYIPVNDGSLPESFTRDLVKAYLNAKKESFMALPQDGFVMAGADELRQLPFITNNLPADKLTLIQNTPTIIKNNVKGSAKAYSDYVFADTLYQEMTAKYPTLTQQMPDFYEREIIDGESVIHVINADSDTAQTEIEAETDAAGESRDDFVVNSELLMRGLFLYLQRQIESYYGELHSTDDTPQEDRPVSKYAPATHYGVSHGKIAWVHQRHYLSDDTVGARYMDKAGVTGSEPLFVDVFTQIFQNAKHINEFARLPSASQTPNANNSVNLFAYQDALRARFKETGEKPPFMEHYSRYALGSASDDDYGYDDYDYEDYSDELYEDYFDEDYLDEDYLDEDMDNNGKPSDK